MAQNWGRGLNNLEPHHTNIISQVQRRFLESFGVTSIKKFLSNRPPSSQPLEMELWPSATNAKVWRRTAHKLPCFGAMWGARPQRFKVDKMFAQLSNLSRKLQKVHLLQNFTFKEHNFWQFVRGARQKNTFDPWNIDDQIIQSLSMHFKKLQNNLSWKGATQVAPPVTESKPFEPSSQPLNYLVPLHSTPMLIYQLTMKTMKVAFH